MNYEADIPQSLAATAFSGTSFSPEARGQRAVADYSATLAADHATMQKHAEKAGTLALLDAEFGRFRAGCRKRYTAYLASSGRCVSWMIAGPSGFPAARMNKRANIAHNRMGEYLAFRERALAAAIRNLRPDLRPIMASDADALDRLATEVAKLEHRQQRMVEANAAIRKNKKAGTDAQVAALAELGYSKSLAWKLLEPDFCGRIGFADYELKNNGANIRRLRGRIEQIAHNQAQPTTESHRADGVRIEDCPAENRVRMFFAGKPPAEVRAKLKSNGFRWSPTIGAWQAYRNHSAMSFARGAA